MSMCVNSFWLKFQVVFLLVYVWYISRALFLPPTVQLHHTPYLFEDADEVCANQTNGPQKGPGPGGPRNA